MTDATVEYRAAIDAWRVEAEGFVNDPDQYIRDLPGRVAEVAAVLTRCADAAAALRVCMDQLILDKAGLQLDNERLRAREYELLDRLDRLELERDGLLVGRDVAVAALAASYPADPADGCVVCAEDDRTSLAAQ